MFQNAAVDVAIGLIMMYLMLSLLCTVVNEFIATKLRLRAKSLAAALEQLLDNQTLHDTFYQHGLIVANKRTTAIGPQSTVGGIASIAGATASGITSIASATASGVKRMVGSAPAPAALAAAAPASAPLAKQNHPSYLSGRTVAMALIGSLDRTQSLPGIPQIQAAVTNLPPSRIRDSLLASLTEAGQDLDKLRTSIATWFDDSMERLSGAYKRQVKWISMLVGLIVAVAFNADSFNVATTLWIDPDRRASTVEIATKVSREAVPGSGKSIDNTELKKAINETEKTLRTLPIGWTCEATSKPGFQDAVPGKGTVASDTQSKGSDKITWWRCINSRWSSIQLQQVAGWLLTAAAISLGAPFWFDLLNKFVNLRGAGGKPEREDKKKAS